MNKRLRRTMLITMVSIALTACRPAASQKDTQSVPADFGTLLVETPGGPWLLTPGNVQPFSRSFGQLSPDGCLVLVSSTTQSPPYPIHEYRIAGTDGVDLGHLFSCCDGDSWESWDRPYGVVWAPDSRGLAVTTGGAGAKAVPAGDLVWVDVPTGTVTHLAPAREAGYSGGGKPHFSPDGAWMATTTFYPASGTVGIVETGKGNPRSLFDGGFTQPPALAWAEDSSGFMVAVNRRLPEYDWELWWVPTTGEPTQLGSLVDVYLDKIVWRPGAKRLAYSAISDDSVHLANHDGSDDVAVPRSTGMETWQPIRSNTSSWSPDGRWLLAVDKGTSYSKFHDRIYYDSAYIIDTQKMRVHQRIDTRTYLLHGWLDANGYLASSFREEYTELYRCTPQGDCALLARLPNRIESISYTQTSCTKRSSDPAGE